MDKLKDGFSDWQDLDYWDGLEAGVVKLAPLSALVPEEVKALISTETEKLKRSDNIFVGPIKDQSGAVKFVEGVKLTDAELLSMRWLVEGVVGTIPE